MALFLYVHSTPPRLHFCPENSIGGLHNMDTGFSSIPLNDSAAELTHRNDSLLSRGVIGKGYVRVCGCIVYF